MSAQRLVCDVVDSKVRRIDWRSIVRTSLKTAALIAVAAILCGFDSGRLEYDLNAFRGQPVGAVVARLGYPIQKNSIGGNRLYYWRIAYFGDLCKIWGIVDKQGIVTNWGYQDCAF
jgi:hypothetical protein